METLYRLVPGHADLVHDLAYDYYGQRMATCSSDQLLKVWDYRPNKANDTADANNGEQAATMESPWVLNDAWKVCST
jgi:WD40 repeat protein